MKIVSEFDELKGVEFNTIADCCVAEMKVLAARKNKEEASESKKKKLVENLKLAENDYVTACENYTLVRTEVLRILEESTGKMLDMLNRAEQDVDIANKRRNEALEAYKNEFGSYPTTTGTVETTTVPTCKQSGNSLSDTINSFLSL